MIGKIGQAVNVVRVLVAVIPAVKALIDFIERPKYGAEKKEAVLEAIATILDVFGVDEKIVEVVLRIVGVLIAIKVRILNLE